MNKFSLIYLIHRLIFRFLDFFHHWYEDGSRAIFHHVVGVFENLDRAIALKVTLKYFFRPLYKDYSVVGRVLGIVFRSGRVLIGFVVYAFLLCLAVLVYLAWIAFPALILFMAYREFIAWQ